MRTADDILIEIAEEYGAIGQTYQPLPMIVVLLELTSIHEPIIMNLNPNSILLVGRLVDAALIRCIQLIHLGALFDAND